MSFDTNIFIRLNSERDVQLAVDRSLEEPVVVFKHSVSCPVSAWARDQVAAFARDTGRTVYEVVVQCARPVSNAIAERYGIRHESPQVIVLFKNRPQFHASHRRVTAQAVQEAIRTDPAQEPAFATPVSY
jgi:bacillithiol system protein YtxJ